MITDSLAALARGDRRLSVLEVSSGEVAMEVDRAETIQPTVNHGVPCASSPTNTPLDRRSGKERRR